VPVRFPGYQKLFHCHYHDGHGLHAAPSAVAPNLLGAGLPVNRAGLIPRELEILQPPDGVRIGYLGDCRITGTLICIHICRGQGHMWTCAAHGIFNSNCGQPTSVR